MSEKPNSRTVTVETQAQATESSRQEGLAGLPQPLQEKPRYKLQDLIDLKQFQAMQDRLNDIYSFPSAIIDNDGNILTATAWQDLCTLFHRANPECKKECIKSDQYILSHLSDAKPALSYCCPHGLVDNALPIMIDGVHYANFFTGQFFLEKPDLNFFVKQAKVYGFDEGAYLEAVKKVPVWSKQQLDNYLLFIKELIEVLSSSGLKQLKEIEARKKIEENEERAGAILGQMSDGFWITDRQRGRIVDTNNAMCQMLGYTRDELLEMCVADIEAADTPEEIEQRIQQVIRQGAVQFESCFRRKDGALIDIEVSVTFIQSMDKLFGFHRDVTERKQAEKLLRERDEQFRSITAASPDALLVSRLSDGLILHANDQCGQLVGIEPSDLINRLTPDFYFDPSDRQTLKAKLAGGGLVNNLELLLKRGDGTPFWALVSARLGMFEGDVVLYAGLRDITERKQVEQERENLLAQVTAARDETVKAKDLVNGILERVSDGFVALDADFNYTYVNQNGAGLLGRTPAELIGKNYWIEYPEARGTPFANAYVRAMETQHPIFFEDYYVHWDRWFSNRIYPSKEGITIFFTDISERKRGEVEMGRINRELRAISNCNQILVRAEDEQTLLSDICRVVCEEAGYRMAWVGYAEPDEAKTVRPAAWAGTEDGYLAGADITWDDSENGRGPSGTAIRMGQTTYIQDFTTDPRVELWREKALQRGYLSSISMPLKDDSGKTFGSLNIYSSESNAFTVNEMRLLEELAGDLAFGITVLRARDRQKQAENALRVSEGLFRAVVENSYEGIILAGVDRRPVYVSPSYTRINGYSPEEWIGVYEPDLIHPEDQANVAMVFDQTRQSPKISMNVEYRLRHKDGHYFWVETTATNMLDDPHVKSVVFNSRDITARKAAEEALQQSQEQFQAVVQTANDAIITMDKQQQIVFWNAAAEKIFGYSADEMIGKSIEQIVPPPTRQQNSLAINRVFINNDRRLIGKTIETVGINCDQKKIPIEISFADWKTKTGHFVTAIIRDISERKQRESELKAIASLSTALRTAPTRAKMMPVIVQQIVRLLNCDSLSIEFIDADSGDSIVEAGYGIWESLVGLRQKKDTGVNAIIRKTLEPYHSHDMQNDQNLTDPEWVHNGIRGCAGVPLIAQEKLIGFIWGGRTTDIGESEVRLLAAIADIAANAIYRATLHEQTQKIAADLVEAYDSTLEGWAHALELRDRETEGHARRVVEKTLMLAKILGVKEDALEGLRRGALLHDIGKMGIPDSVLLKPGTLDEREWEIMRRHPVYAYNLLKQIEYLRPVVDIPYCHHEKWDGSGYPRGLKGEEIPLGARIFAVVDVWDALTNDRPYRLAWSEEEAAQYIIQGSGKHFDPMVVEAFRKIAH